MTMSLELLRLRNLFFQLVIAPIIALRAQYFTYCSSGLFSFKNASKFMPTNGEALTAVVT